MEHNHDDNDYSDFIGATVRDHNMKMLGKIVDIIRVLDSFGHTQAIAITDSGNEVNCRKFFHNYRVSK